METGTRDLKMPLPPLKRSFWYLGGKWGNWGTSEVHSFYSDRPGASLSFTWLIVTWIDDISHLLFCHYKVWDYLWVRSSVDAIAPCIQSARPLCTGGPQLTYAARSRLTLKSNDTGGFSVGPWLKIMMILQYKALLFSHFAAFPQQYSSHVWDREAKRGIKRKWQVLSLH